MTRLFLGTVSTLSARSPQHSNGSTSALWHKILAFITLSFLHLSPFFPSSSFFIFSVFSYQYLSFSIFFFYLSHSSSSSFFLFFFFIPYWYSLFLRYCLFFLLKIASTWSRKPFSGSKTVKNVLMEKHLTALT